MVNYIIANLYIIIVNIGSSGSCLNRSQKEDHAKTGRKEGIMLNMSEAGYHANTCRKQAIMIKQIRSKGSC